MGRREELMLEFGALTERVIALDFVGTLSMGIWAHDTIPEHKEHIQMLVNRVWNPRSYQETIAMIDWVALVERLGFGLLPPGRLLGIYEPVFAARGVKP
jgi:hypothetical protein